MSIKIFAPEPTPFVKKFECGCRYLGDEKIKPTQYLYYEQKDFNVFCKECRYKWECDQDKVWYNKQTAAESEEE